MMAVSFRLARLHLASRRVPASLLVLAVVGAVLRIMLHWTPASGAYSVMFPLTVAAAAASVVSVTTRSPLGEPERATGRRLPWLCAAPSDPAATDPVSPGFSLVQGTT